MRTDGPPPPLSVTYQLSTPTRSGTTISALIAHKDWPQKMASMQFKHQHPSTSVNIITNGSRQPRGVLLEESVVCQAGTEH